MRSLGRTSIVAARAGIRRVAGKLGYAVLLAFLPELPAPAGYYFADDFDRFDPSRWVLYANGYPAPPIIVAGSFLRLGRPAPYTLDFPVIYSRTRIFPTGVDFSVEIAFQYASLQRKGVAIRAYTAGPIFRRVFDIAQNVTIPLVIDFGTRRVAIPRTLRYEVVRFEFIGNEVHGYLNGRYLGVGYLPYGPPAYMWMGHPTVGQIFGVPGRRPGVVDRRGVVLRRWWRRRWWTNLLIDYVRVQPIPEPSAVMLWAIAGGATLYIWRRKGNTLPFRPPS